MIKGNAAPPPPPFTIILKLVQTNPTMLDEKLTYSVVKSDSAKITKHSVKTHPTILHQTMLNDVRSTYWNGLVVLACSWELNCKERSSDMTESKVHAATRRPWYDHEHS
jgi:hypothetical protein